MMKSYNELLEQYEDIRFALMMSKVADRNAQEALREMEELENDPTFEIPEESFKKCRKVIQNQYAQVRRRQLGRQTMRIVNKVALIALVGILCFSTAFAVSEKVRVNTLNFLLETFDDRTEFSFYPYSAKEPLYNINFTAEWVPEGYDICEKGSEDTFAWEYFLNEAGKRLDIEVSQGEYQGMSVDTEDAEIIEVVVQGMQGILICKNTSERVFLFFADPSKAITVLIIGDGIPNEEMLRIGENICY